MRETLIRNLGRGDTLSLGRETILLGWADGDCLHGAAAAGEVEGWVPMADVLVGEGLHVEQGLRAEDGELRLWSEEPPRLFLLSHSWSGLAEVRCEDVRLQVDLFHSEPRVLMVDAATGAVQQASPLKLRELVAVADRRGGVDWPLVIHPMGETSIELVGVKAGVDRPALDLGSLARREQEAGRLGWRLRPAEGTTCEALVGARRDLELILPEGAMLTFACSPGAGRVELQHAGRRLQLDLLGDPGVVTVSLKDVAARGRQVQVVTPSPQASTSYVGLAKRIDPRRPVALYVPRWKGVAMSTRNLFDQNIPIPAAPDAHPDEITDADIAGYAELLLRLGARHFIISGGDTFWLKLIARMHEVDPDLRFDLLWHSNYLQMGEPHDWALLTHWLDAYREGAITRFGVVKEGLDVLLRSVGVEAVFIPNIVRMDPEAIRPTQIDDVVGVWLSGSTEYRKLPYASLMAVAQLRPLALKASGLDATAQRMVQHLGISVRRIWSRPIAPDILHREMRTTAATLYVTLSECSPMLPLESLAMGAPCIVGPSSHLFRDHAALRERLVVEQPLSVGMIAEKLAAAITDRAAIIDLYRGYAKDEAVLADAAVAKFLY